MYSKEDVFVKVYIVNAAYPAVVFIEFLFFQVLSFNLINKEEF